MNLKNIIKIMEHCIWMFFCIFIVLGWSFRHSGHLVMALWRVSAVMDDPRASTRSASMRSASAAGEQRTPIRKWCIRCTRPAI